MEPIRFICNEERKTSSGVVEFLRSLGLDSKTYMKVMVADNKVRELEIGTPLTRQQIDAIIAKYPELTELA